MDVHVVRRVAAVEVDVDVDVKFLAERENAPDLLRPVGIVARGTAYGVRAALQCLAHNGLRAGHIGPAFLQKDAQLQIHAPRVILREALDRIEAAQADVRVDFDMGAHVADAVQQTLLERRACARVNVLDGERVLYRGGACHVVGCAAIRERRNAVQYARFVEMEMALH